MFAERHSLGGPRRELDEAGSIVKTETGTQYFTPPRQWFRGAGRMEGL